MGVPASEPVVVASMLWQPETIEISAMAAIDQAFFLPLAAKSLINLFITYPLPRNASRLDAEIFFFGVFHAA
ncbi:hypothetical protein [Mesorhizobium jarvisii]|uniref:hypothetical protein n=1 Tax=Mesorhizobium jarvisii TaxID=1777867 RepID=UPI0003A30D08|nr:hypothetical protein [Mesorhizobium jarvisii]BCH10841.1 hypothetical protein MesoLj131c_50990 [Mesorhizobium sp. 131-3-5]